ncbi:hypothetical protein C8R46DRAFT_202530 [Mycena filopes]|nr:hypothetical protein C8R46DRAFT_202530 [Mycena filopes]
MVTRRDQGAACQTAPNGLARARPRRSRRRGCLAHRILPAARMTVSPRRRRGAASLALGLQGAARRWGAVRGWLSPRPPSSAGGSARRRGSGSGSYFGSAGSQIMESPTLTMSSRDTPRSASTAPTSVSGTSSWDREEIRELKDKHAVETGALLSALSDSQRTSKVLREENSELRERLTRLEAESERTTTLERENQALREFVTELREEAGQLKLQLRLAGPVASTSRYLAPVATQVFRLAPRPGESPRNGDENISEDPTIQLAAPCFHRRRRRRKTCESG